jgi:hypothetical protein
MELHACLKPGGVLFSSNPRGHNEEGWSGGRYGAYYALDTWRGYMSAAGFAITVPSVCRAKSNLGLLASGVGEWADVTKYDKPENKVSHRFKVLAAKRQQPDSKLAVSLEEC